MSIVDKMNNGLVQMDKIGQLDGISQCMNIVRGNQKFVDAFNSIRLRIALELYSTANSTEQRLQFKEIVDEVKRCTF